MQQTKSRTPRLSTNTSQEIDQLTIDSRAMRSRTRNSVRQFPSGMDAINAHQTEMNAMIVEPEDVTTAPESLKTIESASGWVN